MELRDRVAIVTGGGSGIGEALCRRFVAEGARKVVVVDRHGDQASRVAGNLGEAGEAAELDVADEAATRALVEGVLERHGPIDLYVANAGDGQRGGLELPNEAFERMWQVHVMAHVYGARAVLPSMIARGEGYLLTTASAAGLLTQMDSVTYAITKHAAVGLAEWLAINHHHQGVRVSVLCPQAVRTNILGDFAGRAGDEGPRQAAGDGVLEPEQLADTVIEALREERFHVLPHPQVATYVKRKADDVDRWLAGMRRFEERLFGDRARPGDWLVRGQG
jgi:NAD(P)-dependent dehydrogenase (short-subunit alcohol dehydrogenase family)